MSPGSQSSRPHFDPGAALSRPPPLPPPHPPFELDVLIVVPVAEVQFAVGTLGASPHAAKLAGVFDLRPPTNRLVRVALFPPGWSREAPLPPPSWRTSTPSHHDLWPAHRVTAGCCSSCRFYQKSNSSSAASLRGRGCGHAVRCTSMSSFDGVVFEKRRLS